jgi:hypothetical protein
VNRVDITGLFSEEAQHTRQERRALIKSADAFRRTRQGEIMTAVVDEWDRHDQAGNSNEEYITVLEDGPIFRNGFRTERDHAAMIEHLREIVAAPSPA